MRPATMLALLIAVSSVAACSNELPKAWERGQLAEPIMAWEPDAASALTRERNYQSKEASSGGAVVSGGGCGCN